MALNMKKALAFLKKDLEKKWSKLGFAYKLDGDELEAKASEITLKGFDDDVMLLIRGYAGGGFVCRAIFDKIDKTPQTLELLNAFNDSSAFFKAFIREDGYLELSNFFICYDEKVYKEYGSEFLCRVVDLQENESMLQLSALTQSS